MQTPSHATRSPHVSETETVRTTLCPASLKNSARKTPTSAPENDSGAAVRHGEADEDPRCRLTLEHVAKAGSGNSQPSMSSEDASTDDHVHATPTSSPDHAFNLGRVKLERNGAAGRGSSRT